MVPLDDDSPMPWGKYKDKPMRDVPARYLHWYWTRFTEEERKWRITNDAVVEYTYRNIVHMKEEYPDGIWT